MQFPYYSRWYRCLAFRWDFQTLRRSKDPELKEHTRNLYLEGMGTQAIGRTIGSITMEVSCWLIIKATEKLPEESRDTGRLFHRSPWILHLLKQQNSKCWLWVALDSTFGKVLGFVCDNLMLKTCNELFRQLKGLATLGYDTDFWKANKHFIPTAIHHPNGVSQLSTTALLSKTTSKNTLLS